MLKAGAWTRPAACEYRPATHCSPTSSVIPGLASAAIVYAIRRTPKPTPRPKTRSGSVSGQYCAATSAVGEVPGLCATNGGGAGDRAAAAEELAPAQNKDRSGGPPVQVGWILTRRSVVRNPATTSSGMSAYGET